MKGDVIYKEVRFYLYELEEFLSPELIAWLEDKTRDVLFSFRHYGVDIGNEMVIHFGSPCRLTSTGARVKYSSLGDFLLGSSGKKVDRLLGHTRLPIDLIVERAKSQVGTDFGGYDLFNNNCEHFAFWCATGDLVSYQVPFIVLDNLKYKLVGLKERGNNYSLKVPFFEAKKLTMVDKQVKYPNSEGVWFATLENFRKEIRQATLEEIRRGE